LGGMNGVADTIEKFTDKLGDKLIFEYSNNNSSDSQNVISNLDPFNTNFNLSAYNNQQIELNDDDQIDIDDDEDDSTGRQTPILKLYEEKNNVPFPPSIKHPPEENNTSIVDNIFNFINTSTTTTQKSTSSILPPPFYLPPLYSTPSQLGPVLFPPIYSTPSKVLPLPAQSGIYSIPTKF
jgi:hypothetical protein